MEEDEFMRQINIVTAQRCNVCLRRCCANICVAMEDFENLRAVAISLRIISIEIEIKISSLPLPPPPPQCLTPRHRKDPEFTQ